jgi:hypothetical protein
LREIFHARSRSFRLSNPTRAEDDAATAYTTMEIYVQEVQCLLEGAEDAVMQI